MVAQTTQNNLDRFATLFFIMGALHIYVALRKRTRQLAALGTVWGRNCLVGVIFFAVVSLAIDILGNV